VIDQSIERTQRTKRAVNAVARDSHNELITAANCCTSEKLTPAAHSPLSTKFLMSGEHETTLNSPDNHGRKELQEGTT